MTDTNNVDTDLTYNSRGWLTQIASRATNGQTGSGDKVIGINYDNAGQPKRITQGNGVYSNLTYDAAHRLTDILRQSR